MAARHLIHQPEDQLPFAPSVTGVDDLRYILPLHEPLHILENILFSGGSHIAEGLRQNREVVIAPFLKLPVIARRVHRAD